MVHVKKKVDLKLLLDPDTEKELLDGYVMPGQSANKPLSEKAARAAFIKVLELVGARDVEGTADSMMMGQQMCLHIGK